MCDEGLEFGSEVAQKDFEMTEIFFHRRNSVAGLPSKWTGRPRL